MSFPPLLSTTVLELWYIVAMHPLRATRKVLSDAETADLVQRVSEIIISAAKPSALYLFGSASEGKMTDQSDLDYLVVCPDADSIKSGKSSLARLKPLAGIPVDLIWVTQDEFKEKRESGGVCFIAWNDGKLIYSHD